MRQLPVISSIKLATFESTYIRHEYPTDDPS